jgi:hypothetical protein
MAEDRLSLAEIFARLHERDTSSLQETTKAAIRAAWHKGRLPLIASEVREFRQSCLVRAHVWAPVPAPDNVATRRHIAKLRKTHIVGFLPTIAPRTEVSEAVLYNERLPAGIPYTDIKFDWPTSSAVWYIRPGVVFAQFSDVWTPREAFQQEWPPLAVRTPQQWAPVEIDHLLKDSVIQRRIGRRALARELKSRLDDAYTRGLVTHTMKFMSIYNALDKNRWGLWPVK